MRRLAARLPLALEKCVLTAKKNKRKGKTPLREREDNHSRNQEPLAFSGRKNDK
jgi:hypothetical protein